MQRDYDIAVIGAGAAGLTAAIFARAEDSALRIAALDGAPKIGAKILISGGGRCNVTNQAVTPADFNGNRNAVAKVLRSFTVDETVAWFESMGVTLEHEPTGKLFPTSNRARTVLDALVAAAEGVDVQTRHRVESIARSEDGFLVRFDDHPELAASRVILATGGRSVPKTGSDGHGHAIARSLGHEVTRLFPALVPLLVEKDHPLTLLSGTSSDVELALRGSTGRVLLRHRGSMLFTHFGLSGPVVLDISRHWIAARREDPAAALTVSFLPGETPESLDAELLAAASANPRATIGSVLRGRMPERLIEAVAGEKRPLAVVSREERRALVRSLLEFPLPVRGDRGFEYAEVTAGGVPLAEIDTSTMASRRCEGLYLCGEILDVDGRIGGFNFQWAWASGRLAGMHAARAFRRNDRLSIIDR